MTCVSRSGESWRPLLDACGNVPCTRCTHTRLVGVLDEGLAAGTLNDMREEELFNGERLLEKVLLRTPFQHVATKQMSSIARASDWKRSETLVSKITQQWSGVTQSSHESATPEQDEQ